MGQSGFIVLPHPPRLKGALPANGDRLLVDHLAAADQHADLLPDPGGAGEGAHRGHPLSNLFLIRVRGLATVFAGGQFQRVQPAGQYRRDH